MSHRLNNVNPKFEFQTADGKRIKNLYGLSRELASMQDNIFSHHVSEHKNDFKSWVFDIVKDYTLAKQLTRANSRVKMHRIVKQRIYDLEKSTENVANLDSLKSNNHSEKIALKSLFTSVKTLKNETHKNANQNIVKNKNTNKNENKNKKLELDVKSYLAKLNGGHLSSNQVSRPTSKKPSSHITTPVRTPVIRQSNLIQALSAKSKWKFKSSSAKPISLSSSNFKSKLNSSSNSGSSSNSKKNICPPKKHNNKNKHNVSDVSHLSKGATSDVSHLFKGTTSDVSHLFKGVTSDVSHLFKSKGRNSRKPKKKPSVLNSKLKKLNPRLKKRKSSAEKIRKHRPSKKKLRTQFKLPSQIRDIRGFFNPSHFSLPTLSLPSLHKLGKSEWKHVLLDLAILGLGVTIAVVMLTKF